MKINTCKTCRICVVGFGNVGRSFVKLILDKYDYIRSRYGIEFSIVSIADSSGFSYKYDGFSRDELEKFLNAPRSSVAKIGIGKISHDVEDVLDETIPDFLIELTPANYEDGEPGLTNIIKALKRGISVVTANKAPLVLKFRYLMNLAKSRRAFIGYRATVFGGVPLIDTLKHLAAHSLKKVEGILNATTNYILSRVFYDNLSLKDAIEEAKKIGVMEANPALDLEGIDAAAKIVIIANTVGLDVSLNDVERIGITGLDEDYIRKCRERRKVIKLIAMLDLEKNYIGVKPVELDENDDLAQVKYLLNAVRIITDYNNILIKGIGGGPFETAVNVLSELIELSTTWLR